MTDLVVLGMLVLGFATNVTSHVALLVVLGVLERPRWRGAVALLLPPMAPVWGWRAGRKKTAALWVAGAFVYGLGLGISMARA